MDIMMGYLLRKIIEIEEGKVNNKKKGDSNRNRLF